MPTHTITWETYRNMQARIAELEEKLTEAEAENKKLQRKLDDVVETFEDYIAFKEKK